MGTTSHKIIKWITVLIVIAGLGLSACGKMTTQGARGVEPHNVYGNDGYLGMTNTNPNLRTSPSHHTYTIEQELAQDVLKEFPEIRNARLVFNGAKLTVHYEWNGNIPDQQRQSLEKELHEQLHYNLPHYDIKLSGPK